MPSLIEIRRRIRSFKNMRQITKAMKMVSAAKLRRAQDRVIAARPYANSMQRMLANVAQAIEESGEGEVHPMLARREEKRIQILLITADGGLAGAFNTNAIRAAQRFIADHPDAEISIELMGRKGRDFFIRRHKNVSGDHTTLFQKVVNYSDALTIARKVIERYDKGEIDAVYLITNNFKSVMAPILKQERILPVELPAPPKDSDKPKVIDYIYEQPLSELMADLLPRYVEGQIFRAMLESYAAYQAARMTAMDSASKNAGELIDKETLNMNRVRQASITREIIEIVSGASALQE
jgi:F-type H+-transporting ATPase subunit gamma